MKPVQLQSFDHNAGTYERPGQTWGCGRACLNASCPDGPSRRGQCQMTHACIPVVKGESWACTRPEGIGGLCEQGPGPDGTCCMPLSPCRPTRSIAARRALLVKWTAGLSAFTALLIGFGTFSQPFISELFNPGTLSSAHEAYTTNCASCHSQVADSIYIGSLALSSFSTNPSDRDFETACLSCHVLPDTTAFNPHSFDTSYIAERIQSLNLEDHLTTDAVRARACATCHTEHIGTNVELIPTGNTFCASCHQVETDDFASAHASYSEFSLGSGVRFSFDHAKHRANHFPQEGAAFTCSTCHNAGSSQVQMAFNQFETTCSSGCHHHTDQIKQIQVPVFQLPGIDFESLQEGDISIGTWPTDAGIDLESGITPFTYMLLDSTASEAADRLIADQVFLADLIDMDEAFDDVAILAWGVKAALADIRARGAEILKQRIEQRTGRSLHNRTESVLDAWATTLGRAADLWFPDLQAEVDAFRAGQDVAPREYDGYSFAVDTRDAWTIDTRAFMVYYGVQEHQDVLARSLFESAAGNSNIEALMPALSADRAVGTCLQCHQGAVKNNRMYWREAAVGAGLATTAPNGVASFFDHGPHLSVTECSTCHETSSDRTHPFMPTATATCGTCHGTELTSTMTCASCHQYHNEKPTTIVELDSVGSLAILPAHRAVR